MNDLIRFGAGEAGGIIYHVDKSAIAYGLMGGKMKPLRQKYPEARWGITARKRLIERPNLPFSMGRIDSAKGLI